MRGRRRDRGGAVAQAGQSDGYDDELARIEASIAELKIRDMAAAKERTTIASKIQAAQFQRDILAHANQQAKAKKAANPRRVRRRPAEEFPPPPPAGAVQVDDVPPPPPGSIPMEEAPPPPTAGSPGPAPGQAAGPRPEWSPPGSPHTGPPGVATDGVTTLLDDPPPTERVGPPPRRVGFTGGEQHPPEASTQSVQNITLALGALLIGVAAVVFAGVAVSNPFARAMILAIFT